MKEIWPPRFILGRNGWYSSLVLHWKWTSSYFLKINCNVECETTSVNFLFFSYNKIHWSILHSEKTFYLRIIKKIFFHYLANIMLCLFGQYWSLSYADLPNSDLFHFMISKQTPYFLISPLFSLVESFKYWKAIQCTVDTSFLKIWFFFWYLEFYLWQ